MSQKRTIKLPYNFFEKKAWAEQLYACGIDEAGRGCLAGPLVVGAVILPPKGSHPLLKDSKILSPEQRNKAYAWIIKNCIYSTAMVSPHLVDKINIYQATLHTMRKVYIQLIESIDFDFEKLKYVLIDAMPMTMQEPYAHANLEFHSFNFAETLSRSVAAASIVAKVTRDRLMGSMDHLFPQFKFGQHKGYGTALHRSTLESYGPTILHRTTYLSNLTETDVDNEQQNSLF